MFVARAYFLDTLYARLQDQSAIVAWLAYALWTPALRQRFSDSAQRAAARAAEHPTGCRSRSGIVALLAVAFVLLRRDGRPQRAFERLVLRYQIGLLRLGAIMLLLLGAYGYLLRPQILTPATLAAAQCLLDRSTPECLALQGYVGAPIAVPAHPNAVAYAVARCPAAARAACGARNRAHTRRRQTARSARARRIARRGASRRRAATAAKIATTMDFWCAMRAACSAGAFHHAYARPGRARGAAGARR